ncbi:MAG: hypothetical protein ACREFB_11685 [Stellaceae bacterium]
MRALDRYVGDAEHFAVTYGDGLLSRQIVAPLTLSAHQHGAVQHHRKGKAE